MIRDYEWLRDRAKTGDVLLVEGRGFIGSAIRILTGQQISHVALLLWMEDGLWVAEMKEGKGYMLTPASQRLPQLCNGDYVYHGQAPDNVHLHPARIRETALSYRGSDYSYWTLITTWFSQVFRRPLPNGLVCSTFVQRVWESVGIEFDQTADPGDILRMASLGSIRRVEAC